MKKIPIIVIISVLFGASITYGAELILSSTIYYDNNESNLSSKNVQDAIDELYEKCSNETALGTSWNFDYTGSEQTFIAPTNGTYKLEVWGASGGYGMYGGGKKSGGYGGYSIGEINLEKDEKIYLNVAGSGGQYDGGYNGGGSGAFARNDEFSGGGGGATHISKISGLLSTLSNNLDSIFIIASGGGSTCGTEDIYKLNTGGDGGGISGNSNYRKTVTGATQSSSGDGKSGVSVVGSFGQGGNGYVASLSRCESLGGGGGGLYGGTANNYSGSGGSGYIGNTLLTEKSMYCYNCTESNEEETKTISTTCANEIPTPNCAKLGNGYARITLIKK